MLSHPFLAAKDRKSVSFLKLEPFIPTNSTNDFFKFDPFVVSVFVQHVRVQFVFYTAAIKITELGRMSPGELMMS